MVQYTDSVLCVSVTSIIVRDPPIMLKIYLLCYAALLKNFTYYTQIMLIDIEQFPDIYSSIPMFCRKIVSIWNIDYKSLG